MALYQNERGVFACLALLKIVYFFIGVIELIVGTTSIGRGQIPANKEEHNQCNATIMMHDNVMVGTQQWFQSTPTHASGFQLFTVAMTGHAEEWVQLPQHKVADESLLS